MLAETLIQQALFGFLGGLAAEIGHWYGLSRKPGGLGHYQKHWVYWATTLGMIGLSGLMPMLYSSGPTSALLCFQLGVSTPLVIQKLTTTLPGIAAAPSPPPALAPVPVSAPAPMAGPLMGGSLPVEEAPAAALEWPPRPSLASFFTW